MLNLLSNNAIKVLNNSFRAFSTSPSFFIFYQGVNLSLRPKLRIYTPIYNYQDSLPNYFSLDRFSNYVLFFYNPYVHPYSTISGGKLVKPWLHKEIFLSEGSDYVDVKNIQKFLFSLDKNHNFMLLIVIVSELGLKMAPTKKIENVSYFSDAATLTERINFEISTIVERYHIENVSHIVMRYREFISDVPITMPSTFIKETIPLSRNKKNNLFNDFYAPFSMDLKKFGALVEDNGDRKIFLYKDRFLIERVYTVENNTVYFVVNVLNKFTKELIISFRDRRLNNFSFIRYISGYTLHINRGKITMFEASSQNNKFIRDLNKDYIADNEMLNFITYDLECYLDKNNNNFVPYAAAWYKDGVVHTYYLSDFNDHVAMITKSFEDLIVKENKNSTVYIHNNKGFDSIFTLKPLLLLNHKIKSVQKDKNILSLTITKDAGTKQSIKIVIKDSYLLLPSSLRNLCKSFNLEIGKGSFPHKFASLENLNYIGKLPSFTFFEKDSFESIKNYSVLAFLTKNNWDFRKELIKYLELDVITLHKVVETLRRLTYEQENVDVTKVLSNAGLSFRIFKMNYLSQIPEDMLKNKNDYSLFEWKKFELQFMPKIAILTKNEYNFISQAYYGGHTELYKPRVNFGFLYDINSQYPFAMTKEMPVGNPVFSTDKNLDNYFGIVKAVITTPKFMERPILPIKCADGRTRCVLGTWIGVYCSEELKNARDNYGYTVKVLEGYKFEKGYIFNNFIHKYYELKSTHSGTALGTIYKLILNSLYGRFGMKPIRTVTELVTQSEAEKIQLSHNVVDIDDLGQTVVSALSGYEMITYHLSPDLAKNQDNIENYVSKKINAESQEANFDINVAIAAFITAYARIHIHSYAKKYSLTIYNMDTDSIVTDKPLPNHEIGPELGKMKLEYFIVKGLHSSPKTYWHLPLFNYFPSLTNEKKKHLDLVPIVKSKGTGKDISLESFEKLLNLQTILYVKEKWFKDRENSTINVRQVSLKVRGGTNKRIMVIKNGVWVDTLPLRYDEIPKNNKFIISSHQNLLPAPEFVK